MEQQKKESVSSRRDMLERRRIKAVQRILDGIKQADVARELRVCRGAVSQWYKRYVQEGWEGVYKKPLPGRPITFKGEHSTKLYEIISRQPSAWGYESDLWTVAMARDVLYEQTRDYFSKTRILSELHALGFSFQKPQVKPLEKKTKK